MKICNYVCHLFLLQAIKKHKLVGMSNQNEINGDLLQKAVSFAVGTVLACFVNLQELNYITNETNTCLFYIKVKPLEIVK